MGKTAPTLYFHPVGKTTYGKEFDRIFGKKTKATKAEGSTPAPTVSAATETPVKRKPGRPAGSKNKPKTVAARS